MKTIKVTNATTSEAFTIRVIASVLYKKGVIDSDEFDSMVDMEGKDGKTMVEVTSDVVGSIKPIVPDRDVKVELDEVEEARISAMMKMLEGMGVRPDEESVEDSHSHLHLVEANLEPLVEGDMDDDIEEEDCESCVMNRICDDPKNPYYLGGNNNLN
jgi:hypothetical protein